MKHVHDLLPDYALGELEPRQAKAVEAHLEGCESCRKELYRLNETLVALVEDLPVEPLPEGVWGAITAKLEPKGRRRHGLEWALAASLLIGALGFGWGYLQQQERQQVLAEQRRVAGWLSQPAVQSVALRDADDIGLGSLLILPDDRVLFVLREAPPRGMAYQAWGHIRSEFEYDAETLVSLGVEKRQVFEVNSAGYSALYLSLEPSGGSPRPTRPMAIIPLS